MKNKNVKRLLSVLAVIGLMVGNLAGCGSTVEESVGTSAEVEKTTDSEKVAETKESAETEAASEEAASSNYPDYLNLDGYRPIVKDGEEITLTLVCSRDEGAPVTVQENWVTQWLKETMNINVDAVSHYYTQRTEPKNLLLASGELPDIMFRMGVTNEEIVKYGMEEGMFLPLSDYFSEELTPNILRTLEEHPLIKEMYTLPDGKMYTLPRIAANTEGASGTIGTEKTFVNMKYLKAAGWDRQPANVDEMLQCIRDVQALGPEALGLDELYPVVALTSAKLWERFMMRPYGWIGTKVYLPVWDEAEQTVTVPFMQDKFYDYVEVLNTMYTEGMLHPDYYTMDDAEVEAIVKEDKSIYVNTWGCASGNETWADYEAAHPLASEYLEEGIAQRTSKYTVSEIMVSAETEHPEAIVRLLDYMYSPEGSLMFAHGPQAGTEDTLGIVNGWVYDEETRQIISTDEGGVHYHINYAHQWNVNDELTLPLAQELSGAEILDPLPGDRTKAGPYLNLSMYDIQGPHLVDPLPPSYMSGDQSQDYVDYVSLFTDYVSGEMAKFIVGQRPMDEFEEFQQELLDMGGQEYLDLVKDIYKSVQR